MTTSAREITVWRVESYQVKHAGHLVLLAHRWSDMRVVSNCNTRGALCTLSRYDRHNRSISEHHIDSCESTVAKRSYDTAESSGRNGATTNQTQLKIPLKNTNCRQTPRGLAQPIQQMQPDIHTIHQTHQLNQSGGHSPQCEQLLTHRAVLPLPQPHPTRVIWCHSTSILLPCCFFSPSLGMETFSTPFSCRAVIPSRSTSSGSWTRRST